MAFTGTFKAGETAPTGMGFTPPPAAPPVEPETAETSEATPPPPEVPAEPAAVEPPLVTEEEAPAAADPPEEEDVSPTPDATWTHAQIDEWAAGQEPPIEYGRDLTKAEKIDVINGEGG
jgi:hypothetical protein